MPALLKPFYVTFQVLRTLIANPMDRIMASFAEPNFIKTTGIIMVPVDVMGANIVFCGPAAPALSHSLPLRGWRIPGSDIEIQLKKNFVP